MLILTKIQYLDVDSWTVLNLHVISEFAARCSASEDCKTVLHGTRKNDFNKMVVKHWTTAHDTLVLPVNTEHRVHMIKVLI